MLNKKKDCFVGIRVRRDQKDLIEKMSLNISSWFGKEFDNQFMGEDSLIRAKEEKELELGEINKKLEYFKQSKKDTEELEKQKLQKLEKEKNLQYNKSLDIHKNKAMDLFEIPEDQAEKISIKFLEEGKGSFKKFFEDSGFKLKLHN